MATQSFSEVQNKEIIVTKTTTSWWPSFKWVSASKETCLQAEANLLNQFVDKEFFNIIQHDVSINYDATPNSSKNKQQSWISTKSLWNTNNDETNAKNIKTEKIHTVTIFPRSSKDTNHQHENKEDEMSTKTIPPIVLNHGYGCAGGIYIPAMLPLCQNLINNLKLRIKNDIIHNVNDNVNNNVNMKANWATSPFSIHIIDWLGCGLSSKPKFECADTEETESFFVESLEAWRVAMGIKKFILAGHSLGGYMSCVYAMKYPQYIDHLILISPVGIPRKPSSWGDVSNFSWKQRMGFSALRSLWNSNVTPHDLVRYAGPSGPKLVKFLIERRLGLEDSNPLKQLLMDYLYNVIHDNGSGEYALSKILEFGAWAYKPLYKRISILKQYQTNINHHENVDDNEDNINNLQKKGFTIFQKDNENSEDEIDDKSQGFIQNQSQINSNLKIDFIYGEQDWMDPVNAFKIQKKKKNKMQHSYFARMWPSIDFRKS